jgi:hypothetical protein
MTWPTVHFTIYITFLKSDAGSGFVISTNQGASSRPICHSPIRSDRYTVTMRSVTIQNVLKVPHAKNLGENTALAFSTKCAQRSLRFSRVRYSGSGHPIASRISHMGEHTLTRNWWPARARCPLKCHRQSASHVNDQINRRSQNRYNSFWVF